ncbi:MAG TPA: glycosyltransferase family protein [Cyclobacteriaceae bacterium]|nr:glycosyltransferase family protein [Cyclobacteriaceae bacterium]
MKVLYAIQGTGNGHLSRARDIIPELQKRVDLDIFISGAQAEVQLPYPVKYKSKGLSFYFGKKGGIDFLKTFKLNSSHEVYKEIKAFPVENYDLVINDFEPISAWAAKQRGVPCIGMSHQAALLSKKVPKPKLKDPIGELILKRYAPARQHVSFHFKSYDKNMFTPVIRSEIRKLKVEDNGHYTVYLPAYDDKKLVLLLAKFKHTRWHIFSKHTQKPYHVGSISVYPVRNDDFVISMASSTGVLCGAGFETPAEALYLNKKLLVVPMQSQYEQKCNALALKSLGVEVLKKMNQRNLKRLEHWVQENTAISIKYKNVAAEAVELALKLGLR